MSYPSPVRVPFLQIKVQYIYFNSYQIQRKVFNINTQDHEKPVSFMVKKPPPRMKEIHIHVTLMKFDISE